MSSANSSTGPGMGRTANAASPLSGFGIRPSRTRIFTARIRRRAVVTSASLDCPSERSLILAALEDPPADSVRRKNGGSADPDLTIGVAVPVKPASPAKHRICASCGSTSYPQPQPVPDTPSIVAWVEPKVCGSCGKHLAP